MLLIPLSVLILAWTCRGAPFGVPVADEYDHLYWLQFQATWFPFDTMGSPWYWRPIGRQLYYALASPFFFKAPWLIAIAHAAFLVAVAYLVYRVARSVLPPQAAILAGTFPILAEPSRALLISPNAEMLLALLGAAIAVLCTIRNRLVPASVGVLAGLLSHSAALVCLPSLPLITLWRTHSLRACVRWGLAALLLAAIWIGGHWLGRERGTHLLAAGTLDGSQTVGVARAFANSARALVNLEDLANPAATWLLLGIGIVLSFAAAIVLADPHARARLRATVPAIVGGVAWFVGGTLMLASLTDWNSWRTSLTGLWLGIAVFGLLWSIRPWAAAVFFVLRLTALLLAEPASGHISVDLPQSTSSFGFARIARLQQTVDATRRALRETHYSLPTAAAVRYWSRPAVVEVGFAGPQGGTCLVWRFHHSVELALGPARTQRGMGCGCDFRIRRRSPSHGSRLHHPLAHESGPSRVRFARIRHGRFVLRSSAPLPGRIESNAPRLGPPSACARGPEPKA